MLACQVAASRVCLENKSWFATSPRGRPLSASPSEKAVILRTWIEPSKLPSGLTHLGVVTMTIGSADGVLPTGCDPEKCKSSTDEVVERGRQPTCGPGTEVKLLAGLPDLWK
jgi:hypothetical protein